MLFLCKKVPLFSFCSNLKRALFFPVIQRHLRSIPQQNGMYILFSGVDVSMSHLFLYIEQVGTSELGRGGIIKYAWRAGELDWNASQFF